MKIDILELSKIIVPGLIAVIGNIIFYLIIKGRVDKSIETYKISYSGIFKEKIDIYKEILTKNYDLKSKIQQYQYFGTQEFGTEIRLEFNALIRYYLINQPFLSESIIKNLKQIITELQECFDNFYMHNSLEGKQGIAPEMRTELLKKFFDSGNKFKKNNPFENLENIIINEMKHDLQLLQ
jgi:hypothetical protein